MKAMMLIIITVVVLGVLGYFLSGPALVNNNATPLNDTKGQAVPANTSELHDHSHDHHGHSHTNEPVDPDDIPEGKTGNPHFDQLTPEMQQAVKDSLLLEGPMKTHKGPDGSIILPSNGRFTQMPVAVEMPDGSIQIREYSVTPKPRTSAQ